MLEEGNGIFRTLDIARDVRPLSINLDPGAIDPREDLETDPKDDVFVGDSDGVGIKRSTYSLGGRSVARHSRISDAGTLTTEKSSR